MITLIAWKMHSWARLTWSAWDCMLEMIGGFEWDCEIWSKMDYAWFRTSSWPFQNFPLTRYLLVTKKKFPLLLQIVIIANAIYSTLLPNFPNGKLFSCKFHVTLSHQIPADGQCHHFPCNGYTFMIWKLLKVTCIKVCPALLKVIDYHNKLKYN